MLDHVTPPAYWVALRNQHNATFLDAVNVNLAQHDCMVSELRLRYDHEIMIMENFEKKITNSPALRKRVSNLEATVAVKVGELANLRTKNVGLVEKVFALESDAVERHFAKHASELDARIADVYRDMDNNLYPHMLTAIAGRIWVIGHGLCLVVYKCARSVECQSAMGKVILMAISKGIQQGLEAGVVHGKAESLKDSPIASIMFALVLKDEQDHEMLLSKAIPSVRRFAKRRGLCPPPSVRTFGSVPPHGLSLDVADYQVLSDDGRPAVQPLLCRHMMTCLMHLFWMVLVLSLFSLTFHRL
ncbi:hypothetical protein Tco_0568659 [Tanacetum coccineum]